MEENKELVKDITEDILEKKKEEIKAEEDQVQGEEVELGVSKELLEEEKKELREEKRVSEKVSVEDKKNKEKKKTFFDKAKEKTIDFLKDKYNLAFLVVLVLAFLIRLKYIGQESLWNDAAVHLWYAIKVTKEPLFMFTSQYIGGDYFVIQTLTAFFNIFLDNIFLSGKIIATGFGLLGVVFIYLWGRELGSKLIGLVSAILLGFNHLFWFYNVRLLADGPLTAMVAVVMYLVVKLEKEKKFLWGLLTAGGFLVLMLIKSQGGLLFVIFLIYLIFFKRREALQNKGLLVSWLVPLILIAAGSLILGSNFFANLSSRLFAGAGFDYAGLKALAHLPWIFSWYLLIPIILGIILILIYKKREYYFPLIAGILYWLYFEIGVGLPEDRYLLPLLPIGIVLASFAVVELGNYLKLFVGKNKLIKYAVALLIVILAVLVSWNFYQTGDDLIYNKSFTYTGHYEAGEWIKENVPEDAIVFAGSPRMMRTFTEREYAGPEGWDKGGNSLWYLRADQYLRDKSTFEKDLDTLIKENDVYLEIDIWEYTQPSWYFPLNQDSLNYFGSLGFEPVKVVERELNTQDGVQNFPVIFIFKKGKEN